MADHHFDEVLELRLPAKMFRRSVGIAFDVGTYTWSTEHSRFVHIGCVALRCVAAPQRNASGKNESSDSFDHTASVKSPM